MSIPASVSLDGLERIAEPLFARTTAMVSVAASPQTPAIAVKALKVKNALSRTVHLIALVMDLAMLRVEIALVLLDGLALDATRQYAILNTPADYMVPALAPTSVDVNAHHTSTLLI
jgi:hypothetical protein